MTDVIVLLIIIFFILAGLRKGFCQYLLELLTTAISLGIAWFYYQQSKEIFKSLLVFVWVFLSLSILRWFLLRVRRKKIPQQLSFSFANRFWGAILGFIWGTFISGVVILTLDLLPTEMVFSYNIKQKVQESRTCQILQRLIPVKNVAIIKNISYMGKISLDEKARMRLMEQAQFQELLQHETFKAIMQDQELASQLQNKDLPRLLTNPKILNLLNDGQFVEKLMKLDFKKALEE